VNLRITTAGAVAVALALAVSPAAQAKNVFVNDVFVCNTASQNWQGDQGTLVVSESDPQGALRYDDNLLPKKTNLGLINAASHSRALAVCDGGGTGSTGGSTGGGGYTGGSVDGDPVPTGGGTT
jgi:hypothetical protein